MRHNNYSQPISRQSILQSFYLNTWIILLLLFGVPMSMYGMDCESSITVTSNADDGPGTLRQAISDICPDGRINFSSSLYGQTIILTSGDLVLDKNIHIDGPGADKLAISGNNADRVFYITQGNRVRIEDLTIQDGFGRVGICPPPFCNDVDKGAGIFNEGQLTLEDCVVSNNEGRPGPKFKGGGVASYGVNAELYAIRVVFMDNTVPDGSFSDGYGGALYNYQGKTYVWDSEFENNGTDGGGAVYNEKGYVLLERTSLTNNQAGDGAAVRNDSGRMEIRYANITHNIAFGSFNGGGFGGGIMNQGGQVDIENTLIYANECKSAGRGGGFGGGVYNTGRMTLTNSTISGNSVEPALSSGGGGIYNRGEMDISFSTVVNNEAFGQYASGGGISASGETTISSSIIAQNICATGIDIIGDDITSLGYNLIGVDDFGDLTPVSGDMIGTFADPLDPELEDLADNGGLTMTHALLAGSPAINAADPSASLSKDQRGFERPLHGRADIGAFESNFGPSTSEQAVRSLTLVNADTDMDIMTLNDGDVINLSDVGNRLNIRANTSPTIVGSVRFRVDGYHASTENVTPYAIGGDSGGDYFPWNIPMGNHEITAIPHSESNGQGTEGDAYSIYITFINEVNRQGSLSDELSDIEMYPNPTHGNIQLQAYVYGKVNIAIMNISGKVLNKYEFELQGVQQLDMKHLPDGMYLIEFTRDNERVIKKVVKH